jgi:BolA family transcriptional regulator, general stress-responsive regulator
MSLASDIESRLRAKLSASSVSIEDDSASHAGHGASGAHVSVAVVSELFAGKSSLQRHRLVNDALKDLLASGAIHALQIAAKAPGE